MEKWKQIDCCPHFKISDLGRVRSITRIIECGKQKVKRRVKGQDMKSQLTRKGYPTVPLGEKHVTIHRLVALAFIPNPKNLLCVNHKNGIKTDNRVENLEWCTNQQNKDHAMNNGLYAKGEQIHTAKLTKSEVEEILQLHKIYGLRPCDVAREYNIDSSSASRLLRREFWRHIEI